MQGLTDSEEFVIHKTLEALNKLLSLSLIHKPIVHKLLEDITPLLCHPVSVPAALPPAIVHKLHEDITPLLCHPVSVPAALPPVIGQVAGQLIAKPNGLLVWNAKGQVT